MKARDNKRLSAYLDDDDDDDDDRSRQNEKHQGDARAKRQNLRKILAVVAVAFIIIGMYWGKIGPVLWKVIPEPDLGLTTATPTPTPAVMVYVPPSPSPSPTPTPIPEPTPIRPTMRVPYFGVGFEYPDKLVPVEAYDFVSVDKDGDEVFYNRAPIERMPLSVIKKIAVKIIFPERSYSLALPLKVVWYDPRNRPIPEWGGTLYVRKDGRFGDRAFAMIRGYDSPGLWKLGFYRVEMWDNETLVARKELEVYDDTIDATDIPDGPFKKKNRSAITIPKGHAGQLQAPTPCAYWRDCLKEAKQEAARSNK